MSSIVVNPDQRAENSIYLVFSTVLVTFLIYLNEWRQGVSTGPTFQPNFITIVVISSFIAAALMYAKGDEKLLHRKLRRKALSENSSTETFILLSIYFLSSYLLISARIRPPGNTFSQVKETILEGGIIDKEIWKLRGAFWTTLSIPFSAMIASSILEWLFISSLVLAAAGILSIIVILWSAYSLYNKTANYLVHLAEFHWLDRTLTAVRRSEITVDADTWRLHLKSIGITESMYRAMKGLQDSEEKDDSVPDIVLPKGI